MRRTHLVPVALALLIVVPAASRAQSQPAQALNFAADDAKRIAALHERGVRTDGTHVVLWTPPGVLDRAQAASLVERLDKGVAQLRRLIGSHPWQSVKDQRLVYYVSDDQFIAHANGDETLMIPIARLRDGRAPFIHEGAHALLSRGLIRQGLPPELAARVRETRPQWLIEGIADYFGQLASKAAGVTDGDVFDSGGFDQVDQTCAVRLATPAGQEIAPFIGSIGTFEPLFTTDRAKYAPAFYACAFSYTKYLAAQIGDQQLIGLMDLMSKVDRTANPITIGPDGVLPRIETLTGKSAATVRSEWLKSLPAKIAATGAAGRD